MKKYLITALTTSLTACFLLGCTNTDLAGLNSSDESPLASSDNSSDDLASLLDSGNISDIINNTISIDDESTALISSSEYSLAAIDLFDELFRGSITEVDDSQIETLKNGSSKCDNTKFIGTWNRTYVDMGEDADIRIEENQEDDTCLINGYFDHYGNCGSMDDLIGYFLTDNMMFAVDEESDNTLYMFKLTGDSMEVDQIGFGCMGGGASAVGTYVTSEPEYLNEHDIDFAFTSDELSSIKNLIDENGLDYDEYFENAILYGYFETSSGDAVFEDGTQVSGRWFTAVAPHGITRNLNLFISGDGKIYLESGYNPMDETEFYTTDENATSMPVQLVENN